MPLASLSQLAPCAQLPGPTQVSRWGPTHLPLVLGLRLITSQPPSPLLLHPCPASRQMVLSLSLGGPEAKLLALSYAREVWCHHTLAEWL